VVRIREYKLKLIFLGAVTVSLKLIGFFSGDTALAAIALYVGFELIGEVDDLHDKVEKLEKEIGESDTE
jgi:hypothetical protein